MRILILLHLLLFVGCSRTTEQSKVLNLSLTSRISTLDPAISFDSVSNQVLYQINETLFQYSYLNRPYKLEPLLASSMPSLDETKKIYTIKIKPNIKYHKDKRLPSNRTVVAEDFITQIKRVAYKPTRSTGWWLFDSKIVGLNEFRSKAKNLDDFEKLSIEGLKAINPFTLQIKLTKENSDFLYALAMTFSSPIPMEIVRHSKNNLIDGVPGTGAFSLASWKKGLSITLVKNENYNHSQYPTSGDRYSKLNNLLKDSGKKIPFIDKVKFHIQKETQTRWLNFLHKKIDFFQLTKEYFPVAIDRAGDLSKNLENEGIKLFSSPSSTYWWISFNMKNKLLGKNKYLRKAIAHAIDVDRYINIFTHNTALRANSIFTPGLLGYNSSKSYSYEFNIKKAKEYLRKAGYPNGRGLPAIYYDLRGNNKSSRQMGEYISRSLAKINIKVKPRLNSFPSFLNKERTGQLTMWLGGWALDYPSPENILQLFYSKNSAPGPNSTQFSNREVDKSYVAFNRAQSSRTKLQELDKVDRIVFKDTPIVLLYYSRNYILLRSDIRNYRQSDFIQNYIKYIKK